MQEVALAFAENRVAWLAVDAERPQTSPAAVRSAAISSWSPPIAMFACQRRVQLGSPFVASWSVESPLGERATSASLFTSSSS